MSGPPDSSCPRIPLEGARLGDHPAGSRINPP
ncbi:hypothetical protein XccvBFoX7_gp89c [Xanthomonas phage FoX7]|uniref:Uncharacterized protein n=2 Tax=Carpasinavirus XcP1 TaxID=2182344 RepID=A0A858NY91_9CAUD|nr:hypothetical protein XccvBFoX6_gp89c [Xanthomonas phage FoX6]QJB22246.1 hypothetical protein XccvBFoX7_gp89c [Xanthomonas phage FoX7]